MAMRIALLLSGMILLLLFGPAAVDSAASSAEVAALRDAKARAAAAEARSERLRQEASSVGDAADRILAQRAVLSAEIQSANAQISAAQARMAIIARQQRRHAAALGEANAPMLRLNALLQQLTSQPAALIRAQPGQRSDYVHLRAVMASVQPVLARRTAGLRRQIAISRELRTQEAVAVKSLKDARALLAERRTSLASLEQDSRMRAEGLSADAAIEYELAIGQGEKARELVEKIDADRESGMTAASLAALPGPEMRPGSAGAVATQKPAYLLPVKGTVLSGFGELNPTGYRERGIRIAAAPRAAIVAPAAGKVTFSGPYRSFGNIMVIEHGGGWTSLITNFGEITISRGAQVTRGAIVGRAPPEDSEIMVELRRHGRVIDIAALIS
jgi:murein hydrolase activator